MEQLDKYTDFVPFIPKGLVMFYRMEQAQANGIRSYLEMGDRMGEMELELRPGSWPASSDSLVPELL